MNIRECTKCGQHKSIDDFYTKLGKPVRRCKTCIKDASRSQHRVKSERMKASDAEYRKANRQKMSEYARSYRAKNREKVREYGRNWRELNRQKAIEKGRRWRLAHPERMANAKRKCRLKKEYGLTLEAYDEMVTKQGGKCAICGSSTPDQKHNRFHIDHCHKSGKVRGLLCKDCNTAIGIMKDDVERLRAAAAYLERGLA